MKRKQLTAPVAIIDRDIALRVPTDEALAQKSLLPEQRKHLMASLARLEKTSGAWMHALQMPGEALAIMTEKSRCWVGHGDMKTVHTSVAMMSLEFASAADARAWLDGMVSK